MKHIALTLLLSWSIPATAQELQLPFSGRWFVLQGGDTVNVNQHMLAGAQAFGIDFGMAGGAGQRQLVSAPPTRSEDFFSWGQPVLSPADGVVVAAVTDRPDNALGVKDPARP